MFELRSTPNYSKHMKYFLKVSFWNQSFLLKITMTVRLETRNPKTAEKFFLWSVRNRSMICLKFFKRMDVTCDFFATVMADKNVIFH